MGKLDERTKADMKYREEQEAIKAKDVEWFYVSGYDTGYEWLTRGWNFVHPLETRTFENERVLTGYIPGGPIIWQGKGHYENGSYVEGDRVFPNKARRAWRAGFVAGVNDYVKHNNLDYPMIPETEAE